MGEGEIIRGAAILAAQSLETEHAHALEALGDVKAAAAAEVEFGRGDVGSVLGLEVGQAEEGFAHLVGGSLAQRAVPGVEAGEAVEPVIGRAVERDHVQLRLDEINEGQEQRTVEPILVEIARRTIAGGHHGHAPVANEGGEQPAHDRGVGDVADDHFVESEAFDFLGQPRRDRGDRVPRLSGALFAEEAVDLEHEFVEMHAALFGDPERADEEIHQHRLAAPDPAPQVNPAWLFAAREQLGQQPAAAVAFELLLQGREPFRRAALVGIGFEFARCHQPLVAGEHSAHCALLGIFFTMPEKLATTCASCTTIPRTKTRLPVSRTISVTASSG